MAQATDNKHIHSDVSYRTENRPTTSSLHPAPLSNASEVTKEWLEAVLEGWMIRTKREEKEERKTRNRSEEVVLKDYTTQSPDHTSGYLSDILFLSVRYSLNDNERFQREHHLALKFLPLDQRKRGLVLEDNVATREIGAYDFFGSDLLRAICSKYEIAVPVPGVFYAGLASDTMTLVLQDLKAEGYTVLSSKEGISLEKTKKTLEVIAVVHALGRVFIKEHGEEQLLKYCAKDVDDSFLDNYTSSGIRKVASLYSDDEPIVKKLLGLLPVAERLRKVPEATSKVYQNTLIHGDYWAGQVMFNKERIKIEVDMGVITADRQRLLSPPVKILDWQFARFGNALTDVVSILLMSSEPDVYENHLNEVLESYWHSYSSTLTSCGLDLNDVTPDLVAESLGKVWHLGLMLVLSSVETHLAHGKVTEERIRRVMEFMDSMEVLDRVSRGRYGN